jgi:hypothetical protein
LSFDEVMVHGGKEAKKPEEKKRKTDPGTRSQKQHKNSHPIPRLVNQRDLTNPIVAVQLCFFSDPATISFLLSFISPSLTLDPCRSSHQTRRGSLEEQAELTFCRDN